MSMSEKHRFNLTSYPLPKNAQGKAGAANQNERKKPVNTECRAGHAGLNPAQADKQNHQARGQY